MKLESHLQDFTIRISAWLADGSRFADGKPRSVEDVLTGQTAWTIAHCAGICSECYKIEGVNDRHIATLLKRIFPNAVFKES